MHFGQDNLMPNSIFRHTQMLEYSECSLSDSQDAAMLPNRAEADDIASTAPLYFVGYSSGTLMYTELKTLFAKKLPKVLIGVAKAGQSAPVPMQMQHAPNIEALPFVRPTLG